MILALGAKTLELEILAELHSWGLSPHPQPTPWSYLVDCAVPAPPEPHDSLGEGQCFNGPAEVPTLNQHTTYFLGVPDTLATSTCCGWLDPNLLWLQGMSAGKRELRESTSMRIRGDCISMVKFGATV